MGGAHRAELRHSPPLHFLQNSVILHGKTGYREGAEQDGAAADHGHSGGAHLLSAHPKAGEKPQPPGPERSGEPVDAAGLPGRGGGRHGPGQMPVDHPGAGAAVGPGAGAAAGARPAGVPAAAGGGAGPGLSSGAAPWGGLAGAEAAPYEEPVGQLPLAAGLHHPEHRPGPLPGDPAGLCGPP